MSSAEEQFDSISGFLSSTAEICSALRHRYKFEQNGHFEGDIRHAYQKGYHEEISRQVMAYLEKKFETRDRIATYLNVTNTNVSKMKSNASIPVKALEIVISSGSYSLPVADAAMKGLIAASHHVRRFVFGERVVNEPMSCQEFYQLLYGETNEWYDAFVLAIWVTDDYLPGK